MTEREIIDAMMVDTVKLIVLATIVIAPVAAFCMAMGG